jgi:hypothetical protein
LRCALGRQRTGRSKTGRGRDDVVPVEKISDLALGLPS